MPYPGTGDPAIRPANRRERRRVAHVLTESGVRLRSGRLSRVGGSVPAPGRRRSLSASDDVGPRPRGKTSIDPTRSHHSPVTTEAVPRLVGHGTSQSGSSLGVRTSIGYVSPLPFVARPRRYRGRVTTMPADTPCDRRTVGFTLPKSCGATIKRGSSSIGELRAARTRTRP
jgi:hypothetical protein